MFGYRQIRRKHTKPAPIYRTNHEKNVKEGRMEGKKVMAEIREKALELVNE